MAQPEAIIQKQILGFLKANDIFCFPVKTTGTYDVALGRFRKPGAFYRRGVADILGIYKGRALAIEVKAEKGRLAPHQKEFLEEFARNGGIAMCARSLDQVKKALEAVDAQATHEA